MKPVMIIGILLILAGAGALAMGVFTVKETDTVFEVGDLKATTTDETHYPLKPAGIGLLAAGVVLVAIGAMKKK